MGFRKAARRNVRLRLGIAGTPGSGKTITSLRIGTALLPTPGEGDDPNHPRFRLAVIDTEHGSAEDYEGAENPDGGVFDYDVNRLDTMVPNWRVDRLDAPPNGPFSTDNYVDALREAEEAGYFVVVLDSLSHAWNGPGGIMELVDALAAKSNKGNKFTSGWSVATPKQHQLVHAILSYPGHVIVTMRMKMAYELEQRGGRQVPVKIGLQPIQREGVEYEFTLYAEMEAETHVLRVVKSRCPLLPIGREFTEPGADFAEAIREWLEAGANWHDEMWDRDRSRFHVVLGEIGVDYEAAVAELQTYRPGLRPSQVGRDGRKMLIERLKAQSNDNEREPGEEG